MTLYRLLWASGFAPEEVGLVSAPPPFFDCDPRDDISSRTPNKVSLKQTRHWMGERLSPRPTTQEKRVLTAQFRTSTRPSKASRDNFDSTRSRASGVKSWSAIVQSIPREVKLVFTSCCELPYAAQHSNRADLVSASLGISSRKSSTMSLRQRNPRVLQEDHTGTDLSIEFLLPLTCSPSSAPPLPLHDYPTRLQCT